MDNLTIKLREEIESELEDLSHLQTGSDEKSKAIEDLAALYKLTIDESKSERDQKDLELKETQSSFEAKSRYLRLGADIAGIVLPLIFYAFWMCKGLKFEETGSFTSTTFRGLFNKFKPVR